MSPNPETFLQHLRQQGYHSRSNKHSNALGEAIVADLLANCPAAAKKASSGQLVYDLNFTIRDAQTSDWNVDVVLGAPPPGTERPGEDAVIRRTEPSTVQIAIEIKSVMTEHGKAIHNRKRDLEAHHDHVHRYSNHVIAAGVFVINQASSFKSPLRPESTEHRNPEKLVEHCIRQMRAITSRNGLVGSGLEAKAAIIVDMDNQDLASTRYVSGPPAPTVGDPLHYDAFIQSLCQFYVNRFV